MKVVRSREHRTYKKDGNGLLAHELGFTLSFDSPRTDGTLSAAVVLRNKDFAPVVGDVCLSIERTGDNPNTNEVLQLGFKVTAPELTEFADGLKAAVALALDLFGVRPPERIEQSGEATEEAAAPPPTEAPE